MNASVSPIAVADDSNLRISRRMADSDTDTCLTEERCDDVMTQTKRWVVSSKTNLSNDSFRSSHSSSEAAAGARAFNNMAFGPEPPLREAVNNLVDCLSPIKPIAMSSNTSYVSSPQQLHPARPGIGVQPVVLKVVSPPLSLREAAPLVQIEKAAPRSDQLGMLRPDRQSLQTTKSSISFNASPACAVDSPPQRPISASPLEHPGSITARKDFYEDIIFRRSSKGSDHREAGQQQQRDDPFQVTQTFTGLVQSPHYRVLMDSRASSSGQATYMPEGFRLTNQRNTNADGPLSTSGPGGERRGDQLALGPQDENHHDPRQRLPNIDYIRIVEPVKIEQDEQWAGEVHGLRDQYDDESAVVWGSGGKNKTPSKPQTKLPVNQRWQGSVHVTGRSRDIDPTMLLSNGRALSESPLQTSRSVDSHGRASLSQVRRLFLRRYQDSVSGPGRD